jgi:hypothetical protein
VQGLIGQLNGGNHMKFLIRPRQTFLRQFAEIMEILKDEKVVPPAVRAKYEGRLMRNYNTILAAYEKDAFLSEPVELSVFSELITDILDQSLFQRLRELPGGEQLIAVITRGLLGGVDITRPQQFTKPVYMMIDELDFSGGDASPATLQDYGRVKLIGLSTAGAGGTVEEFSNPFGESFGYHLTTSLMYRKGGIFVENVGVKPDFVIEPSIQDYKDGFSTYFDRVMGTLGL